MYVCIFVCIYTHMYNIYCVCMEIRTHKYIYTNVYVCVCVHVHVCVGGCGWVGGQVGGWVGVRVYIYIYLYICTYIYIICIHINMKYIQTYIHICVSGVSFCKKRAYAPNFTTLTWISTELTLVEIPGGWRCMRSGATAVFRFGVCMYVCMYVCCMYAFPHVRMYAFRFGVRMYVCCMYACLHVCMYVYMHI